jgi:excisionase family DNA binding protein
MDTKTQQLLVDADQLTAMLGISLRQVRRLDSAGQLPGRVKLGRLVRWRKDDIEKWTKTGCKPQTTKRR